MGDIYIGGGGRNSAHSRSIEGDVAKGLQEHRATNLNSYCLLHMLYPSLGGHLWPAWAGRAETEDPAALDTDFSPNHLSFFLPQGVSPSFIIYILSSWLVVELHLSSEM